MNNIYRFAFLSKLLGGTPYSEQQKCGIAMKAWFFNMGTTDSAQDKVQISVITGNNVQNMTKYTVIL